MREALDLLFRTGLLTLRGEESRVIAITHWESEQEPLPSVQRHKALSAERSRRYRVRQVRLHEQPHKEEHDEETRQRSLSLLRDFDRHTDHHSSVTFRHADITFTVTRDGVVKSRYSVLVRYLQINASRRASRHRKRREEQQKRDAERDSDSLSKRQCI
jgi:hypothetical protein